MCPHFLSMRQGSNSFHLKKCKIYCSNQILSTALKRFKCANGLQNGLCNKLHCLTQNKVFLRMKKLGCLMLVGHVQANILLQQSQGWTIALYSNSSYQFQIKQNILFKSNFVKCSEKIQICANGLQKRIM